MRVHNPYDAEVVRISRYTIDSGDRCSLHVHTGKTEAWLIVRGSGQARVGDVLVAVKEGDVVVTPPGREHDLRNTGPGPLVFANIVLPTGDAPITTRGSLALTTGALVITGGAGFVAIHAAEVALARGLGVTLLDIREPPPELLRLVPRAEVRLADIRDAQQVAAHIPARASVIHCAAVVGPAAGKADPVGTVDVNVMGTARLLDRIRSSGGRWSTSPRPRSTGTAQISPFSQRPTDRRRSGSMTPAS